MDRLAMLEQMASAKPYDPFVHYGLAMELKKRGELERARTTFERLVEHHPSYVATYLMFGNLLVQLGDRAAAVATYDRGVEVAKAAGDEHTVGELSTARAELT